MGVQQVHLFRSIEGAAGVRYLAQANWTLLTTLHITESKLGIAAVECLVRGPWPLLAELSLMGTQLNSHKISILLNGNWPELQRLMLDKDILSCKASAEMLGLEQELVEHEHNREDHQAAYRRKDTNVWPNLGFVLVQKPDNGD